MKEEIISYKTAKLAENKGFDEEQNTFYHDENLQDDYMVRTASGEVVEAPTQSLLQRWLREVHNKLLYVEHSYGEWAFVVEYASGYYEQVPPEDQTFEEALEEGLKYALNLIK